MKQTEYEERKRMKTNSDKKSTKKYLVFYRTDEDQKNNKPCMVKDITFFTDQFAEKILAKDLLFSGWKAEVHFLEGERVRVSV